jgi:chromosome partitioning protein
LPRTLALITAKGGSGKSTIAILLADALAIEGRKVLLIDADPQGSVSQWFKTATARGDRPANIDVARATTDTELATLLGQASSHDDRIIDVPGVADKSLIVAANAADLIIIPARVGAFDAAQAIRTAAALGAVARSQGRSMAPYRLVMNGVNIVDLRGVALREVQRLLLEAKVPILSAYFAERGIFKTFVSGFGSLMTTRATDRSTTEARRNVREVVEELGLLPPRAKDQAADLEGDQARPQAGGHS